MTPSNPQPMPDAFLGNRPPNSPPIYLPNPFTGAPTQLTMDDNMYWAHQPLPVQAMRGLAAKSGLAAAILLANQLAAQGYAIDYLIMVLGSSPTDVMAQRFVVGLTWEPRLGSSSDFTNLLANPGAPGYDPNKIPADAILVRIDAAYYTPVAGPVVVAPTPSTAVRGPKLPDGNFEPGPGTLDGLGQPKYKLGDVLQINGGNYQLVRVGLWNSLEWQQLN